MIYAEVILPFPLAQTYSYAVPEPLHETLAVGMRVVVPFGARRFYTGIVCTLSTTPPPCTTIKSIAAQLDERPILFPEQLQFWKWLAQYYRATLGDVFKTALPSAMKLESETTVELAPDANIEQLSAREKRLVEILSESKEPQSIEAINKAMEVKDAFPAIKRLLAQGVVALHEEISEQYRPRTESYIALADPETEPVLPARAKKQRELLLAFRAMSKNGEAVRKIDLLAQAGATSTICKQLIDKGIFVQEEREVARIKPFEKKAEAATLTPDQQRAYDEIRHLFETKNTVLLHGVMASGKTEIYTHLIADTLAAGKQVLYLVPEIALTTQLTERLKDIFGDKMAVFHSKFSEAERVEIWNDMLGENPRHFIVGARNALFLPFQNLGLIVVDEEHDASYKQSDTAPRYNARNAALVLAWQFKAKTILGSATPSVESYCNALNGKYGLVTLNARYGQSTAPEMVVVDLTEAYRKKQMTGHLSDILVEKIRETFNRGEQVILFQNRRGFAPYTECRHCGWTPRCPHCDVSLNYHKAFGKLTCHYCGYKQTPPTICPQCGEAALQTYGFGTEQVENEVATLFPEARIARMDLDTTRQKKAFNRIIGEFEAREIDLLVGTQMVAKGLDFDGVGLVGILNADNLLNYPDFRAYERAFQLLTQVSGRAGRKDLHGTVVLQTSQPNHPVIAEVLKGDYRAFFDREMHERSAFRYPPYFRLVQIILKHTDAQTLSSAATQMANALRRSFGDLVYGPDNPPVGRIQNKFIKHIVLKIAAGTSPEPAKQQVDQLSQWILGQPAFRGLQIAWDAEL
jgi:primosomal protein N' (replication factor Y) (superfamily II helicase)